MTGPAGERLAGSDIHAMIDRFMAGEISAEEMGRGLRRHRSEDPLPKLAVSETTPYTAAEMVEHLSGSDNDLDDGLMGFPGFRPLLGAHDDRAQIDLTFEAADESGRATTEFRVTVERIQHIPVRLPGGGRGE